MKSDKGAISIPTIIIVIVLIVLGGICIFMLTGENGLFVPKRYEQDIENNNVVNEQKQIENVDNTTSDDPLTVPIER